MLRFRNTRVGLFFGSLWIVGCALSAEGNLPPGGEPCSTDAQCPDLGRCAASMCGAQGVCEERALPDGDLPDHEPGDCHKAVCRSGVEKQIADAGDAEDDGDPCTDDVCEDGASRHPPMPDGTGCEQAGHLGVCSGGSCEIVCKTSDDCASEDPCTIGSCDLDYLCAFEKKNGVPTPGAAQVPGDCRARVCVAGVDTNVVDDGDRPATQTDCDLEQCDGGVPSNPPRPKDASCSTDGGTFCDGQGACVECNDKTQCTGSDDGCVLRACNGGACTLVNAPANLPVGPQIMGTCHTNVCDGAGSVISIVDDTDVPVDGNDCTDDVCTNGAPSNPFKAAGSPCGSGLVCNAVGLCTGCTLDEQCQPPAYMLCDDDTNTCFCTPVTCALAGKTCGVIDNGCGGALDCDDGIQNGDEGDVDCGALPSCANPCANGMTCSSNAQCQSGACVDGVCCDGPCAGLCEACSAAKKGNGSDGVCGAVLLGADPDDDCEPEPAATCGLTGSCDGTGQCQEHLTGTQCAAAFCSDPSTLQHADACDGAGTCSDGGSQDCAPYACAGSACLSSCSGDGDCAPAAFCDGSSCAPKRALGQPCGADSWCVEGHCAPEGICCDEACATPCRSCATGTCGDVASGTDDSPPGACGGAQECAAGSCLSIDGQSCATDLACASGHCVDGTCCDTACQDACMACDIVPGACLPIAQGGVDDEPAGACTSPSACDGAGVCKAENGAACAGPDDCASGNCPAPELVCCDQPCADVCFECGTGACTLTVSGKEDSPGCVLPATCDGAGLCE
jgi:hypothetical protein